MITDKWAGKTREKTKLHKKGRKLLALLLWLVAGCLLLLVVAARRCLQLRKLFMKNEDSLCVFVLNDMVCVCVCM